MRGLRVERARAGACAHVRPHARTRPHARVGARAPARAFSAPLSLLVSSLFQGRRARLRAFIICRARTYEDLTRSSEVLPRSSEVFGKTCRRPTQVLTTSSPRPRHVLATSSPRPPRSSGRPRHVLKKKIDKRRDLPHTAPRLLRDLNVPAGCAIKSIAPRQSAGRGLQIQDRANAREARPSSITPARSTVPAFLLPLPKERLCQYPYRRNVRARRWTRPAL